MKRISIIGSTGSIGENALKIIKHLKDELKVEALAAKSNIDLLERQAKEFHPKIIAVFDKEKAVELKKRLPDVEVVGGMEGIKAAASFASADFVVSSMVGTLGLIPTLAAISAGKNVGLANKEALVSGGSLVMQLAKEKNIQIIPIDSEHSAIFQCLTGEKKEELGRLIITSSGGPFRTFSREQLLSVNVKDALNHPTWKMGPKVTVDSSTLMNKGLEVIEAHFLFDIPVEKIDVVVHPQSIIHSMCEFIDGSIKAQMGEPSMIIPIQYAMTYPDRKKGMMPLFDFVKNQKLDFYMPDLEKFRCLRLAYDSLKAGGSLSCFMNAANEVLVEKFLKGEISWQQIGEKLEDLMLKHSISNVSSIEDVLLIDSQARKSAEEI
ncbi:MAG TPA: 1-deoxy-D-xylulose-5-phosphate reductoisomerase [Parachlamydiaceae bacterium]|nr:1-deoxy-D-xylulose-5-phosphate reductoisomerase [Parachlamydiaceae bacterium]